MVIVSTHLIIMSTHTPHDCVHSLTTHTLHVSTHIPHVYTHSCVHSHTSSVHSLTSCPHTSCVSHVPTHLVRLLTNLVCPSTRPISPHHTPHVSTHLTTCRLTPRESYNTNQVIAVITVVDGYQREWRCPRMGFTVEQCGYTRGIDRMSEIRHMHEGKVKLDIGGNMYTTSLITLSRDPDSMLAAMFSGRHDLQRDTDDGSHFIDRDGVHFRYILNYLRDGGIQEGTLPDNENIWRELLAEAQYYQIEGLVRCMENLLGKDEEAADDDDGDDDSVV